MISRVYVGLMWARLGLLPTIFCELHSVDPPRETTPSLTFQSGIHRPQYR